MKMLRTTYSPFLLNYTCTVVENINCCFENISYHIKSFRTKVKGLMAYLLMISRTVRRKYNFFKVFSLDK